MIKSFLNSFQVLTSDEITQFESLLVKRYLKKGTFFISEGKCSKEVAFINTGILRSFYTTESGEEMTYCISFPNSLMTAYSSYITGQSTIENIQAVVDTELLIIQKHDIDKLQESSPNWIRFSKIMAEMQYLELEKRLFVFQKDKAKKRYIDLLENQPGYVQKIPLQYLASYLGITPRHLSRLRKEIQY